MTRKPAKEYAAANPIVLYTAIRTTGLGNMRRQKQQIDTFAKAKAITYMLARMTCNYMCQPKQPFAMHLNTSRVVLACLKKDLEACDRYVPEMGSSAIFDFYKTSVIELREYSILLTDTVSD